jgi:hypothetical protein
MATYYINYPGGLQKAWEVWNDPSKGGPCQCNQPAVWILKHKRTGISEEERHRAEGFSENIEVYTYCEKCKEGERWWRAYTNTDTWKTINPPKLIVEVTIARPRSRTNRMA